jgi:putative endonuclease
MSYYVYLIKCKDNSYYCGYTTNLKRRVQEHNQSDKGAKYTSGRRPVKLKYSEEFQSLSKALKREYEIKQLTHKEKEALTNS